MKNKRTLSKSDLIEECIKTSLACLLKKLELVLVDQGKNITEGEIECIKTGLATSQLMENPEPDLECDDPQPLELRKNQNG